MSMGNRIRQARKNKGYTQEYVAQVLGVSRQAVFKWEKDQTRPDTANLVALAQLLDTKVDQLLGTRIPVKQNSSDMYFKASLLPLIMMPLCWLIGMFSGVYTDMLDIPVGNGARMGLPFLMYGHSPLAVILVTVSIISLIIFLCFFILAIKQINVPVLKNRHSFCQITTSVPAAGFAVGQRRQSRQL